MAFPPPELNNFDRLLHLYADNTPLDKDVVDFWHRALRGFCLERNQLTFTAAAAEAAFVLHGVFPASLKSAIVELEASNLILPRVPDAADEEGLLSGWFSTLLSLATGSKQSSADSSRIYYHTGLLSQLTSAVSAHAARKAEGERLVALSGPQDCSFSKFLQDVAANSPEGELKTFLTTISPDDASALLDVLVARGVARTNPERTLALLLPPPNKPGAPAIPHHLSAMHQIRLSLHNVSEQVDKVDAAAMRWLAQAKAAKAAGRNDSALMHLHMKRSAEERRRKLLAAQLSLHQALQTIEDSTQNTSIVEAYRTATIGLRMHREATGLTAEAVEEAVEEFQEELENIQGINEAIESVTVGQLDEDEQEELQKELDELLFAEKASAGSSSNSLPEVPSHAPTPTVVKAAHIAATINSQAVLS